MRQRYPILFLLTILLAGCGGGVANPLAPAPTAIPFARYSAQDVINALSAAGLSVLNPVQSRVVGRGAPTNFADRYTFEIERIAPLGGQIVIFDTAEGVREWQRYVDGLRTDPATRRDVIYVYVKDNVLLQVNSALTTSEASAYEAALSGMG